MSVKIGKAWGVTECIESLPTFALHKLTIKPNFKCSLHEHRRKVNGFWVFSGRLFIDVIKNDYALTDTTELGPGDYTRVAPDEHHLFRTGDEPCVAFELYYLEPLSDADIRRKGCGGPVVAE